MKQLIFSLILIGMFACQNSTNPEPPKNAETTQAPEVAPDAIQISPEAIQAALTKALANSETADKLFKDAEAASTKATGTKKEALVNYASELESAVEKLKSIASALKSAAEKASDAPAPMELEDHVQSVDRYQKELEMMKAELDKIISGKK